jgi:hypothetical protein
MVGRDLPKLCPHGEDHQGRRGAGGEGSGNKNRQCGSSRFELKNLTVMIQIHKALVWILGKNDLLAILFNLPGLIWPRDLGLGGVMLMRRKSLLRVQKNLRWMGQMHYRWRYEIRKRRLYSLRLLGFDVLRKKENGR